MALAHVLGFPRIGAQRELKVALEVFWRQAPGGGGHGAGAAHSGVADTNTVTNTGTDTGTDTDASTDALLSCASALRARHWALQDGAGLDCVAVGDFSLYDQVLDTLALLGALPRRFGLDATGLSLPDYFTMARGSATQPAMAMTKWFDTNYHYLVPEWDDATRFDGGVDWLFDQVGEAVAQGYMPKVVLIGPLTLLYQGTIGGALAHKLDLLPQAIDGYRRVLQRLARMGVTWVQMDEPILCLDLEPRWRDAFAATYAALAVDAPALLLATYFSEVVAHAALLKALPVAGLHLDLVRGPGQLAAFADDWPQDKVLSLGVIDGRNVWAADLETILALLVPVHARLGERLWLAASCSLLHVPVDLRQEHRMAPSVRAWLAFAVQKLEEIALLKRALNQGVDTVAAALQSSRARQAARRTSPLIHNSLVQRRLAALTAADAERASPFVERQVRQQARFRLPLFPTTTIGSFPQTEPIRRARADYKRGTLPHSDYLEQMRAEIALAVERQEALGLDVLVHGEAERNDMVEYFGEQLWGFAFSDHGWVQSYGSRCVKPPIIYGDVYRSEPMTVAWSSYAQSLSDKPMKGMLTGPVTMLQWSFVRDDQPREQTALQIALALRDEVLDLERAGIGMIQIDEPAFREGLPLKAAEHGHYLDWAVRAFKIAACGVGDATQIHTHMCYSEFNDVLPWIAAMDADVITIETSRSAMRLLDGFAGHAYPNDIGPGVYDIHSPRVASIEDMHALLMRARQVIADAHLWVNPDCGLKTRAWPETEAALANMVAAARLLRQAAGAS